MECVMECVMECEDTHGTKFRLQIRGSQLPDLATWIGKLWNRER